MGLTPIVDRGKRDESRFCGYGKNPIIMGLTPMRQYNLPQCLYQWDYAMGLTPIAGRGKRDESRFCGYGKNPIIMGLTPMRQYNLPQCLYQWD